MPAYDKLLQLKASGVQTVSTSGTPVDLGTAVPDRATLLQFDTLVTALSGAGATVDLVIEESPDQTNWRQVTTFRQLVLADGTMTGANQTGKKFSRWGLPVQRYIRYRSTLGGSASVTFAVNCLSLDSAARGMTTASF